MFAALFLKELQHRSVLQRRASLAAALCLQSAKEAPGISQQRREQHSKPRWYDRVEVAEAPGYGVRGTVEKMQSLQLGATVICSSWPGLPGSLLSANLQGGFQVKLDQRDVRTPGKNRLVLPSKLLAYAIAAEWQWQVRCCFEITA